MPMHGDFNEQLHKWYCSYWLTLEEWEDIHDYMPSSSLDVIIDKNNDSKESDTDRESEYRTE
jgi:hypothetical protein